MTARAHKRALHPTSYSRAVHVFKVLQRVFNGAPVGRRCDPERYKIAKRSALERDTRSRTATTTHVAPRLGTTPAVISDPPCPKPHPPPLPSPSPRWFSIRYPAFYGPSPPSRYSCAPWVRPGLLMHAAYSRCPPTRTRLSMLAPSSLRQILAFLHRRRAARGSANGHAAHRGCRRQGWARPPKARLGRAAGRCRGAEWGCGACLRGSRLFVAHGHGAPAAVGGEVNACAR